MTNYTSQDIRNIINNGFLYKLPDETNHNIQEMCHNMNVFFSPSKIHNFGCYKNKFIKTITTTPSIDELPVANDIFFKKTILPKIEGIDKIFNDIRICLNKISPKNVDNQYNFLIEKVSSIFNSYDIQSPEIKKTINIIFEICSLNKFYAEIYAVIYSKLILQYPIFYDYLIDFYNNTFLQSFEKIKYIDSNIDYDGFCQYNKENDNRKANTMFIIQLMKRDVLTKNKIIYCIEKLLEIIFSKIIEKGNTNEVEEITENIYIFIKNTCDVLNTEQEWEDIIEKIYELSQMKHNMYPSISNRAIFKYMDLVD